MGPVIFSCHRKYTPLPDGYFRIDPYPEEYKEMTLLSPFISFEIPDGTTATLDKDTTLHKNDVKWLNIRYPRYRATIYCSYHILHKNLESLLNESKDLVYRQSIRPDFIKAGNYEDPERKIYATLYNLSAESATPLQFVVTDSTRYLLRGALYFDESGKSDAVCACEKSRLVRIRLQGSEPGMVCQSFLGIKNAASYKTMRQKRKSPR